MVRHRPAVLAVLVASMAVAVPTAGAAVGDVLLLSRADGAAGAEGDDASTTDSSMGALSSNGRLAVFTSAAANLVAGDTNTVADIFLRDRTANTTTRVSVASDGTQGNAASSNASISPSGRHVVFTSAATNLVAGDTNGKTDVFVRDLQAGTTTRVSVATDGAQGDDDSASSYSQEAISDDGRSVVFTSYAKNFGGRTDGSAAVYIRDLQTQTTSVVSRASGASGAIADSESDTQSITPDGRYVAFESSASNLGGAADGNTGDDDFVRDLQTQTTTLVSHNSANTATGNHGSATPAISADGRYVAFGSMATDLMASSTGPGGYHIFVRDMSTGTLTQADVSAAGGLPDGVGDQFNPISADGRFVAFMSSATNLVGGDTDGATDVFVRDLIAGTTQLVSRAAGDAGALADQASSVPSLAVDGRFVGFVSQATDLVASDGNGFTDVFVRTIAVLPPVNGSAPLISGSATPGQTLTCSAGTWSGAQPITYAYQWSRDGSAIDGATAATYAVVAGDVGHQLACGVTATNEDATVASASAAVTPVLPATTTTPGTTTTPPTMTTPPAPAAPAISGVTVAPSCVRAAALRAGRKTVSFRLVLSENATVTFALQRRGTTVPHHCPVAHAARGTARRIHTYRASLRQGRRKVSLARIAAGRRLPPGVYVVTIRATNANGRSKSARAPFWAIG